MPHKVDPTLPPLYATIYEAIRQAVAGYGISPSQGELIKAAGCSSTTVQNAFRVLRQKGYITFEKFGPRTVRPTDPELTISREPRNPWDDLGAEVEPYWTREQGAKP